MPDTDPPNEDDVLRRMLATPAKPHKLEKPKRQKIERLSQSQDRQAT